MSRWWRAYEEAVDDPKLIGLTDQQHRFWFNILCVCSAFGGRLPHVRIVSIKLRMQPRKVVRLMNELKLAGLLDEDNGLIFPHNWQIRQYKSDVSTERVKRFRKRERNVSGNVSETPPENRVQKEKEVPAQNGAADVVGEEPKARLFRLGKTILVSFGVAEKRTGALIGQWLKTRDDPVGLLAAIQFARDQNVAEPVSYISAVIAKGKSNGIQKPNLCDLASELADEARQLEREAGIYRPPDPFGSH